MSVWYNKALSGIISIAFEFSSCSMEGSGGRFFWAGPDREHYIELFLDMLIKIFVMSYFTYAKSNEQQY